MRKEVLACAVVFLVVVVALFELTKLRQEVESPVISVQQETLRAKLSEAEERDLEKLIPQTLLWISMWMRPLNCSGNENIQDLDFKETFKRYDGKEIEMRLEIHEGSLVVSLDSLHTSLRFVRLHKAGLTPAEHNLFCENSYKEYKAEVTHLSEINRPRYQELQKEQQLRDPKSAEVMESIRKMHSPPPEDKVLGEETRQYRVMQEAEGRVNNMLDSSDEKRALYDRVLNVIRAQEKLSCAPGEAIRVTIPRFNLGDPAIYILIKGPFYGGGDYIEWIDFDRDPSTGEYTAQHIKSFGLPDEIGSFASLIKKKQIAQLGLRCS